MSEPLSECIFDIDGSVLNTGGDCYDSCNSGYFIQLIKGPSGFFCCCKDSRFTPIELGMMRAYSLSCSACKQ